MYLTLRNVLYLVAEAGIGFFVYKTIRQYFIRRKYCHIPGPPANGLFGFYLGNLDEAVEVMRDGRILCDLLFEWVAKYGPTIKFQILDKIIVFTVNQEAVKEALITKNLPKVPEIYQNVGFPYNERYLGNGLITNVDNNSWKERRALHNPAFFRHNLMDFFEEVELKSDILLERFKTFVDRNIMITMFDEVNHLALDIIASIAFGLNADCINHPENEFNKYVYESLKGFYRITFDPFIFYKPYEWGYILNYKRIIRRLRQIAREQIQLRIKMIEEGQYAHNDILTNLLKANGNKPFDVEDLVDEFLTFFVAGQETTANTLSFCFLEIARNPEVLKKLRNELDEVLGSRSDIQFEDLAKLNYTNCIYKETLRLWPPIPEIARMVDSKLEINGIKIPKNTWLQLSTYVSSRQEDYFEDPTKFKPERFLYASDENSEKLIKNYTYFPFSLGARNCIGQNLAQIIGKVMIAKVVKNFDIVLDQTQNFGIKQEATLRPRDGIRCKLESRKF